MGRRICTLYTHSRFIAVDSIQTTMASPQQLRTKLTDLLKIQHPVMLAGMNVAAGPKLAAAVTNAGGLGVIGGIFNGQSLAAMLTFGATGVWVGTRFILSEEAGAPKAHQEAVKTAGWDDNIRTIIFTGRPLRIRNNPYVANWEENRQAEIKELTSKGILPVEHDLEKMGDDLDDETMDNARPFLMGKVAAVVNEKKTAREIVDELVTDAVKWLNIGNSFIVSKS